jgi:hypothetical protein
MNKINFATTPEDSILIAKISERAVALYSKHDVELNHANVVMDITATHMNGCPLNLEQLLIASDFDFMHDITRISNHLNRTTGKLEDSFLPKHAK